MRSSSAMLVAVALCVSALQASAADLEIALTTDPDILDPARGGSVAGRVVFAAMCDKLIDVTPEGGFEPQLATGWEWSEDDLALTLTLRDDVLFHDGTAMDAEAVKINLDRARSDPNSLRRGELAAVTEVEVVDPLTVRLVLSEPFAPLVAALSDRSGMVMSPTAIAAQGEDIGLSPVCAGPFRFVERVAQDRIVLERFPDHWDAGNVFLDRVIYRIMPDASIRLANLRSGDVQMIERVSPTDIPTIEGDPEVRLIEWPSIAYDQMVINTDYGPDAEGPLGQSALVRQALSLAIDRDVINDVLYEGRFIPANQPELAGSTYWDERHPVPPRDVEKARALLAEAGVENPSFTLMVSNNPTATQLGEMIQAMAGEAGFRIEVQALEPATWVAASEVGEFEANIGIWSGRPDPDGNITPWASCDGFLNRGKWCNEEFDGYLADARRTTDVEARKALYRQALDIYLAELPQIQLHHYTSFWATRANVEGFVPHADGLIRLTGVRIVE